MSNAWFQAVISPITVKDGKATVAAKPVIKEDRLCPRGESYVVQEALADHGIDSGVFHCRVVNPRSGNIFEKTVTVAVETVAKTVKPENVVAAVNAYTLAGK